MLRPILNAKAKTCPVCRMMRRAKMNALAGMVLSGGVLGTLLYGYLNTGAQ